MDYGTKVWLAAASLHDQGKAPFRRQELVEEAMRLFPRSNPRTFNQYARPRRSGMSSSDVDYLSEVSPNAHRLTRPSDVDPPDNRWPKLAHVDQKFHPLWQRWVAWQQHDQSSVAVAAQAEAEVAPTVEEVDPAVHFTQSTYREAMLEHLLVGELMRYLWPKPLEVCKPQVDAAGYDLILQCDGVLRHVQLKTSVLNAATASVNLQVELWKRHGGCVIWTRFDPDSLEPREFWWLGGPSQPFPAVESLGVAKHARTNMAGEKKFRPSLRKVPKGCFKRLASLAELVEHLFGDSLGEL